MPNTVKVSADQWIQTARDVLIEDGLAGVKADRLAKRLGVTRGGFYHNFDGLDDLLSKLVTYWADNNQLIPDDLAAQSRSEALKVLEALAVHMIHETGFSTAFEQAVREWARIDASVRAIVEAVDVKRIDRLTGVFSALGCDDDEAAIRAKVWYFHQLGYYSLGYHDKYSVEERMSEASVYLRILCGKRYIEAAEHEMQRWS